ncbi:hypothetical protein V2J09_024160 [Rumex salicifolius]
MAISPAMAATSSSISLPFSRKRLFPSKSPLLVFKFSEIGATNLQFQALRRRAKSSSSETDTAKNEETMSIENLRQFVDINIGIWTGSFYQFGADGKLLHKLSTKLAAGSYGEAELLSLIQTLYIKQGQSSTSFSGSDDEKPEWAEYKIKESNMFTVDKYQQISFFPKERAFALRYQTAVMLETVLRQGVLGEDDTGEKSPRNLKLPSRRPALVCENCLYSLEKDVRARAFHIMDPQGFVDMLLIFLEERGGSIDTPPSLETSEENTNRLLPFLGKWKGYSVTKRSGVYNATIAEHDTVALLEINDSGQLIQDITSTVRGGDVTTNVHWTGSQSDNLVIFDKGYQFTILPGGMYMGYPCDIAKSVAESMCFHLEFCWTESPGKRQRLVRTYDAQGLAVSSTYISETRM